MVGDGEMCDPFSPTGPLSPTLSPLRGARGPNGSVVQSVTPSPRSAGEKVGMRAPLRGARGPNGSVASLSPLLPNRAPLPNPLPASRGEGAEWLRRQSVTPSPRSAGEKVGMRGSAQCGPSPQPSPRFAGRGGRMGALTDGLQKGPVETKLDLRSSDEAGGERLGSKKLDRYGAKKLAAEIQRSGEVSFTGHCQEELKKDSMDTADVSGIRSRRFSPGSRPA